MNDSNNFNLVDQDLIIDVEEVIQDQVIVEVEVIIKNQKVDQKLHIKEVQDHNLHQKHNL
jgi:hypothetical protein